MRLLLSILVVGIGLRSVRADDLQDPWSLVPINTRAVVVVPHMSGFSDKVDHVADVMKLHRPGVLEFAIRSSGIRAGLDREGPLLWVYGPRINGRSPVVYLLPASDSERLIRSLKGEADGEVRRVTVGSEQFLAAPVNDDVGFSQGMAVSRSWLLSCRDNPGGGAPAFGSLNRYLRQQDIGFMIAPMGVSEGIDVELPFSRGDYVFPKVFTGVTNDFKLTEDVTAAAGGVRIDEQAGVVVSVASLLPAQNEVSRWSKSMDLKRDDLLGDVPDGEFALLFATSIPDEIKRRAEVEFRNAINGQHAQAAVLAQRFDLSKLKGLTVAIRPAEGDLHWASSIELEIHCENAAQSLVAIRDWLKILLADAQVNPNRLRIDEHMVDGGIVLTLPLDDFNVPTTIAMGVLNDKALLLTGGGVDRLERAISERDQPRRISDDEAFQTASRMLRPDCQTILFADVQNLALWLMNVYQERGGDALGNSGVEAIVRQYAEMFRDTSPLALGNHFGDSQTETELIATNQLLESLGKIVRSVAPQLGN